MLQIALVKLQVSMSSRYRRNYVQPYFLGLNSQKLQEAAPIEYYSAALDRALPLRRKCRNYYFPKIDVPVDSYILPEKKNNVGSTLSNKIGGLSSVSRTSQCKFP